MAMKILVIPSWYPPKGGRFFKYQAEALADLGHKVDVLVLNEIGLSQKVNAKIDAKASEKANEIVYDFYRIPKLNEWNRKRLVAKYQKILLTYLKENKPDVVHIHSVFWAGIAVAPILVQKQISYVLTTHQSLFLEEKFPFKPKWKKAVGFALEKAQEVVAVSSQMKNVLLDFAPKIQAINSIPNMVNTHFFHFDKKIKKAKDVWQIISVGELVHKKGYDILLKALVGLNGKGKTIQLNIIGNGKEKEWLTAEAKQLGVEDRVTFCGYKSKDELLAMYQQAHFFVSSSRKEPFGVVIIEAMACGLPIVATHSGGPTDIVKQHIGYLAENNNANSLQAKMQAMIDNYTTFDAENIRKHTLDTYSEQVVILQIEKSLKQCQNSKKQLK